MWSGSDSGGKNCKTVGHGACHREEEVGDRVWDWLWVMGPAGGCEASPERMP